MQNRTTTQSFGVSKREGHDSSSFYGRKLYSATVRGKESETINQAPTHVLDRIFAHSSENMSELPDNSVALMVTSPPYNVGKDYDLDLTLEEYLNLLERILKETQRVLLPGGRIAFNVANVGRKPYIPLNSLVAEMASRLGLLMRGEIIWVKGKGASGSCAWGSWMSAGNPTLRDLHEYILIFCKGRFDRTQKGKSTIGRDEFMRATTSVWDIAPESARRVGHPAPFPVALVERLVHLYTFEGDVVLDPFMGSGSSAIAAKKLGRHFVGYEINPEYIEISFDRLNQVTPQIVPQDRQSVA
ncbi:MAG: site-specific DNA-methyltransferase [Deltaproteobacteria bacterium]|nr:site-specific DNA-methyltransferase [Deltaproteobacteria bacterium]